LYTLTFEKTGSSQKVDFSDSSKFLRIRALVPGGFEPMKTAPLSARSPQKIPRDCPLEGTLAAQIKKNPLKLIKGLVAEYTYRIVQGVRNANGIISRTGVSNPNPGGYHTARGRIGLRGNQYGRGTLLLMQRLQAVSDLSVRDRRAQHTGI
jgi:hypothetical protein